MCTSTTYQTANHYFGRNLDLELSYGEEVVIIPRNFPFHFREVGTLNSHYAIIGIAYVTDVPQENLVEGQPTDYPLLYDAVNEKGLGIAGLNFVGNAVYHEYVEGKDNIAQFELLPWILSRCANVNEVKTLLQSLNLRNFSFSQQLPASELHWNIADSTGACIVLEATARGLQIYNNPVGVLTNNPTFDKQRLNLSNYQHLSAKAPENKLAPQLDFPVYSRGMGAMGLPGDLSSESRYIKASFTKLNSISKDDEVSSVNQYFHILHSVDQQYGCCDLGNNKYEYTIYSDCYNLEQGIFYYTTYHNHQISSVSLKNANLDDARLTRFPLIEKEQIHNLN